MTLLIGLQGICPKNLKHNQLSNIMLQLKATSFASFSSLYQLQYPPSFSDTCESGKPYCRKVFTNFQNDLIQGTKDIFEKHVKNHQISSNYATFTPNFAPKAAHHQIRHIGETHWLFQKGMTNLVLWKFSQSLENNGTKILKIRASLFLSCTP